MSITDYFKFGKTLFFKKGSSPLYLVLFVTDRCNAKCKHCLLADGVHQPDKGSELTLDEFEKLSTSMDQLLFLLPTGGEPFIRDDLGEIIKIFYRNNRVRNIGVPTNGFFTEKIIQTTKDILTSCPELDFGIDVSIDGIKEVHDGIRGVSGLFDKAVETFHHLKSLEKTFPKFNVNIETTVSSYNDKYLSENYDYFTKELKAGNIFTLLTRDKPRDCASKFFDIKQYEAYADKMEKGIKTGVLKGYYTFPFSDIINAKRLIRHRIITKIVQTNKFQIPCYAGLLGATVFSNGDVYPCELHTDMKLGNLRDYDMDFKTLWNDDDAEKARIAIKKDKCFCTYECFLTINILFNPLMIPTILKEWAVLKWARLFGAK